jgi:arginine utilization protein RocB
MAGIDEDRTTLCRRIALDLVRQPSVTGSADEARFGPWLAQYLRGMPAFAAAEISTFPVAEGDPRHVVTMLIAGASSRTVVLTGHYDTVATDDYGPLAPLACDPEALGPALQDNLTGDDPHSRLVREDLAGGRFLPGRGLLDMKGGLAAALAALATSADLPGSVLFVAVPDEENASAGARAAAASLGGLAARHALELAAVINLDSIADDGDGSDGQVVALGTVGKTLPTALVIGRPVHSGFALRGLNAAVLAGAIAARLEWAPELTDDSAGVPGTAASLLSLRDGKQGYDVTTPAHAFAFWNVLHHRRSPAEMLDAFERLARAAVRDCLSGLASRAARSGLAADAARLEDGIPVLRYADLRAEVAVRVPDLDTRLNRIAGETADCDLPERCRRMTLALWQMSGRSGPAVVLGFGSMPYLATTLAHPEIEEAIAGFVADAPARHGCTIRTAPWFPGISDMSFFGQSDAGMLHGIAAQTPVWDQAIGLHAGALAQLPTINLGPWGRDYHTPFERIETTYAFGILPGLIEDLTRRILAPATAR